MFKDTGRNRSFVGGAAGLTLALALAVAIGVLPQAGDDSAGPQLAVAAVAPTMPVAAPEAPPATEAPVAVTEAPAVTAAPSRSSSSPGAAASVASEEAAPEPASAVSAPAAATATGVARTTPSSAQVQAAIQGIHQRIPIFTPTAAQVADFGNQVCSAFDSGQSYSQVKATGLQMVTQYPFVSITSADADWMIHTAVSMYCPGHADKF
ncbi:MAG TPA: DUF732 domain-containing protein [Acidimicrobiales bacterium]|nr:DUF732 domain-containing protein [Acidimicrobiales bacterium]